MIKNIELKKFFNEEDSFEQDGYDLSDFPDYEQKSCK